MSSKAELDLVEAANHLRRGTLDMIQMTERLDRDDRVSKAQVHSGLLAAIVLAIQESNSLLRALLIQGHEHDGECLEPEPPTPGPMVFQVGMDSLPEEISEFLGEVAKALQTNEGETDGADNDATNGADAVAG